MKKYRCPVCGYECEAEAPTACPVCGCQGEKFELVEVDNTKKK